jgi:NTE family protein
MAGGERVFYHHLASRSPWRSHASMGIPRREGMIALAIQGLPRPTPFDLAVGPAAIDLAYARTREALDRPVEGGVVRV